MLDRAPEPRGTIFSPRKFTTEHEYIMIAAYCASREDAVLRLHLGARAADFKAIGDTKMALFDVCKIDVPYERIRKQLVKLKILQRATHDAILPADRFIASRVEELLGGAADPIAILRWGMDKFTGKNYRGRKRTGTGTRRPLLDFTEVAGNLADA